MAPVMTGRGEISPCDQGRLLNVDNFTDPLANDDTRLCFDIGCIYWSALLFPTVSFPPRPACWTWADFLQMTALCKKKKKKN